MEFTKLDIKKHDLYKVADLLFETEPELQSLLFGKNKDKALSKMVNIVKAGKNTMGHENIYLATESNQILGLTCFFIGDEIDSKVESVRIKKAIGLFSFLRIAFYDKTLLKKLLTATIGENNLYIANVSVEKNNRGQGVGKFILNNVENYARKKNCISIILDVSKENEVAIGLYNKLGFEISKERTSSIWNISTYQMLKVL